MYCNLSIRQRRYDCYFRCYVNGRKNILMYPTISHVTSNNEDIYIEVNKNLTIESWINFDSKRNDKCNPDSFIITLYAWVNKIQKFYMNFHLASPNYAYLECSSDIYPKNYEKISCILDTNKFPINSDLNLKLPDYLPDIGLNISNWEIVPKDFGSISCPPNLTEIQPYIIREPECAMNNYNTFLAFISKDFAYVGNNFSFELNVLLNDSNGVIPCEFYQKKK